MNPKASGGVRWVISDGTNTGYWNILGGDIYDGGWVLLILDTATTPDADSGSPPNMASVTNIGLDFSQSSAPRNADNTWWDFLVYGEGYKVTGGTDVDAVAWTDIADRDANLAEGWGLVREVNGVFFVNGELTLGSGSADLYFEDSGKIIVFTEDPVAANLYKLNFEGSGNTTTSVIMGEVANSGDDMLGFNGCVIYSAGSGTYTLNANVKNIDAFKIYGSTFDGVDNMYLGDTTTPLGTTGSIVHIIDNLFARGEQLTRAVSSDADEVVIRLQTVNFTDSLASVVIADDLNIDAFRLSILNNNGFTSEDDEVTESIEVLDHDFSNLDRWLYVYPYKTWDLVNAVGTLDINSQNDLTFVAESGRVTENFSLALTTNTSAGAALSGVYTYVYEGLLNQNLPSGNRQVSDVNGEVLSNILTKDLTPSGGTDIYKTIYGDFGLKAYKYNFVPVAQPLTVNAAIEQPIIMLNNANITETDRSTAESNGAGITVNNETYSASVLSYTGGAGTLSVNDTVLGSPSSASGIVVKIEDGDSTAGDVFLKTRNTTDFANGDSLNNNGAGWTSTYTNDSEVRYAWWANCNSLAMTVVYDYFHAKLELPDNDFINVIEWGEDEYAIPIFLGTNGYYSERNVNLIEGWFFTNRGAGTMAYLTGDDGSTYILPVQYTITLTNLQSDSEVRIYNASTDAEIAGTESSSTTFQYTYTYSGDISIYIVVHHLSYHWLRLDNLTLSNANQSIPVQQITDRNYSNP
jgi:hypothetical protein